MTPPAPHDTESLLAQMGWVRSLALRLVCDPNLADDLVQDTMAVAIERPIAGDRPLRSFLGGVLRNLVRQSRRGAARRLTRESRAAKSERGPDTQDVVERLAVQRRLVDAVAELQEPFRTAVLLRFFDELPPRGIAEWTGAPLKTVKSRLTRGVAHLRERLLAEHGGDREAWLGALASILPASPIGGGSAVVTAGAVFTPALAGLFVMYKTVVAAGLLAIVATAFWYLSTEPDNGAHAAPALRTDAPAATISQVDPQEPVVPTAPETPSRREEVATFAGADVEPEEPSPAAATAARAKEPLNGVIVLTVVDTYANPLKGAAVVPIGFRAGRSPGSSYGWRGEPREQRTDSAGIARIEYPLRHGDDGAVFQIGFRIRHPDCVPYETFSYPVSERRGRIILTYGSLLRVSGWIDSPREQIIDVEATLSYQANLQPADWFRYGDGRPATANLSPGRHDIFLTHRAGDGRFFHSEVVRLELGEQAQEDLHLRLHPARAARGRLDASVPRPVMNGEVWLNLGVRGEAGDDPRMMRLFKAPIEADGSFLLEDLPIGRGEIIAVCDGWASRTVLLDEDGTAGDERTALLTLVVGEEDQDFVLLMEPTASLRVTALNPEGEPEPNATIVVWPNVHWEMGFSMQFVRDFFTGTTDHDGVVTVEHIPAGEVTFGLSHPTLRLPEETDKWGNVDRNRWTTLTSGQVVERTLTLEQGEGH